MKRDYTLPRPLVTNTDLRRLINSDEIQSVVKAAGPSRTKRPFSQRKNPLKNVGVMVRMNPYAQTVRRRELLGKNAETVKKAKGLKRGSAFVTSLLSSQ